MTQPKFFKALNTDGTPIHGSGKWSLPTDDGPGDWMPEISGPLVFCKNGYHACRPEDLAKWLGATIYELEYRGEIIEGDEKVVVQQARLIREIDTWTKRSMLLFAVDCAQHVLPVSETKYPDYDRPRKAIEATRQVVNNAGPQNTARAALKAAAQNARAAASDLTRMTAVEATASEDPAATAANAVLKAATNAAFAAETTALDDAAAAVARVVSFAIGAVADIAAEEKWQTERLMQYLFPQSKPE